MTDRADQPDTGPISPLRQRMLEDMAMHGLRDATQRDYLRFVRSFAAFLRRPPDTATPEDIRRFQVFQAGSGSRAETARPAAGRTDFRPCTNPLRGRAPEAKPLGSRATVK